MLFPSGLALGEAFYDRDQERRQLLQNIRSTYHTVLIAPRRFGKTSLIRKVIEDGGLYYIWLDFMTLTTQSLAQSKLLDHIADIIMQLGKTEDKIRSLLRRFFTHLQPELTLGHSSIAELKLKPVVNGEKGIIEALESLDQMAQDCNQRLVIIFDEFQEITRIDEQSALQASIRHAAEKASYVTYLFSGSKHRPLRHLFNGKQNPLYELCEQMTLGRIDADFYRCYLQEQSQKHWGYPLNDAIIDKILEYTECYPKYVNALCSRLWLSELEPTIELVNAYWQDFIFTRKDGIRDELDMLSMNERHLLYHLAFNPTNKPFSKDYLKSIDLSHASFQRALTTLQDKDLVVKIDDQFRVIDPTFKHYFAMF